MELDSFSGNEVTALFSDPAEIDYSIRSGAFNLDPDAGMTILSRADMEGTFPQPATYRGNHGGMICWIFLRHCSGINSCL